MPLRTQLLAKSLFVLSALLLAPNFIPVKVDYFKDATHGGEKFDPALAARLRSVNDVVSYTDSLATARSIDPKSLSYGLLLTDVIQRRFEHGYSSYRLSQNWVASLAGSVKRDLAAVVIPDDILTFDNAACSQQTMVLMEALGRKGIDMRTVLFHTHFAVEARYNGAWRLLDADVEPEMTAATATDAASISATRDAFGVYDRVLSFPKFANNFLNYPISYGAVNAKVATNTAAFHKLTKVASRTAFLLPLLAGIVLLRRGRRRARAHARSGSVSTLTASGSTSALNP
ncbi:hypothetical protein [Flaviaesturariibacter amylovorans]|uniref:Transglutaminase domain-containing protein n=1 Tax=Flaviaesturariibacter amylovorans TaxID=1084520 RepID=A0ABP8GBY3_9BACT